MQILAPDSVRAVSLKVVSALLRGRQRQQGIVVDVRKIAVFLLFVGTLPHLEVPAWLRYDEREVECRGGMVLSLTVSFLVGRLFGAWRRWVGHGRRKRTSRTITRLEGAGITDIFGY
jgi:hypothetical protein